KRRARFGTRMNQKLAQAGLRFTDLIGLFAATTPPVPRWAVRFSLHIMRFFGLFQVARYITRDGLRIICYHGFAIAEEYKYRSNLFIRDDLFRRRMAYLRREGYPILPLSEAVEALS